MQITASCIQLRKLFGRNGGHLLGVDLFYAVKIFLVNKTRRHEMRATNHFNTPRIRPMESNDRMIYYFVSWTLDRLDPGMDEFLTTLEHNWKERVLQSEGVRDYRASQWKRRVHKYRLLHDSYCALYNDLEEFCLNNRRWHE